MFHFLRTHPEHTSRICDAIIDIFKKNLLNERITYPLLNFLSLLISSGTIDSVVLDTNSRFSGELLNLVKLEIKGHKKLYKLVSSISVFCQLIKVSFFLGNPQFSSLPKRISFQVPQLSSKILTNLSLFLGLTHVHVRKCTATKLYEALILYGDECGIPEENLDEV